MWQKKLEISIVPIWYKNGTIVCVFSLYLKLFAKIQNIFNIEKMFLKPVLDISLHQEIPH